MITGSDRCYNVEWNTSREMIELVAGKSPVLYVYAAEVAFWWDACKRACLIGTESRGGGDAIWEVRKPSSKKR